jgi:ketosteroid isomerase-like protein
MRANWHFMGPLGGPILDQAQQPWRLPRHKEKMPTHDLVQRFIGMVEGGRFVEAMKSFYADDAVMQENNGVPRKGLPALIAHEQKVLAAHAAVRVRPAGLCLVDGDHVVIRWVFEFTRRDGRVLSLDELSWQRWSDGWIVQERFYYDPSQLSAA